MDALLSRCTLTEPFHFRWATFFPYMCIHFFFAMTDNAAMNIFVHKSFNYPSNYVLRVDIF